MGALLSLLSRVKSHPDAAAPLTVSHSPGARAAAQNQQRKYPV